MYDYFYYYSNAIRYAHFMQQMIVLSINLSLMYYSVLRIVILGCTLFSDTNNTCNHSMITLILMIGHKTDNL